MQPRHITHVLARGMSVALVGFAGLLAACEAKMPTAADIDQMDAASAERNVRALGLLPTDSSIVWSIDGVPSTAAAAKMLLRGSIEEVSVNKLAPDGLAHIDIVTKLSRKLAVATIDDSGHAVLRRKLASGGRDPVRDAQSAKEKPLYVIDGARSDQSAFSTLDRTQIEAIEILKGPSAIKEYGEAAKNGVIVVRTKR